MLQGGGGGVQRNRVFSELSQISPRPNITPAQNIIYIFSVINFYKLEPAAPIIQKYFFKYIDIFKRVNVPSTPTALYKIVYVVQSNLDISLKA